MAIYEVQIPFAGHLLVSVEAANPSEAAQKAMDEASTDNIESWEPLRTFNTGNVCHCPSPWSVVVMDEDGNECEIDDDE